MTPGRRKSESFGIILVYQCKFKVKGFYKNMKSDDIMYDIKRKFFCCGTEIVCVLSIQDL
jgi:hypothetical protein